MYAPPPPAPPRPGADPKKAVGIGCLGCLGSLILFAACGAVIGATSPQPAPTAAGRTAKTTSTRTATPTPTPTPTPTADEAARRMCTYATKAIALSKAGWDDKASTAVDAARDAARQSTIKAVRDLRYEYVDFEKLAGAWCRKNLPTIKAKPVKPAPKRSRTPDPGGSGGDDWGDGGWGDGDSGGGGWGGRRGGRGWF